MSSSFSFSKSKWDIRKDKKVCETPVFSLNEIIIRPPGKNSSPFYVLKAPEWVNVVALTPEKKIVLVEQYRAGINQPTLEIPGGIADNKETPLESARRELLEETGFSSQKWSALGKISSNPAIMSNYTHLFLAEECIETGVQQPDATEDIAVHVLPLEKFLALVKNGEVHHALVVAAVAHLLLHSDLPDGDFPDEG